MPLSPARRALLLGAFLVLVLWPGKESRVPARDEPAAPRKRALLVGCTAYPNQSRLRQLSGPINDVRMWERLLTDPRGLAFPRENVKQLAGWPAEAEKRPTYANIVKAFKDLIDSAGADDQVFILLSGHGIQ